MLALAAAWALAAPAAAQDGEAGDVAEARLAVARGLEAARAGEWDEAREAFSRAYALAPRPLILLNLASAQAQTGRLVAAADGYRRVLASDDEDVTESHRRDARRSLASLVRRLPRVTLAPSGHAPTDSVELDERAVEPNVPIEVDPGGHVAALRRGSDVLVRRSIELAEEERVTVALAAPGAADPLGPAPPAAARSPLRSPVLWVAVGAAAIGVIVIAARVAGGGGAQPHRGTLDPPVLELP